MEYVVGALIFLVLYAVFVWRKARAPLTRTRKLIRTHLKTLVLKRARGFTRDDYGKLVDSGWSKEIAYFYDKVIPPDLQRHQSLSEVARLIEQEVRKMPEATIDEWTMADRADVTSGEDFETLIAGRLEDSGWHVRRTGKAGDQGADLLADKGDVSVAVQCKLYSQPVGNKAVQEVLAAQRYYATRFAAVVSNAAFTKSAMRLAQSANVLLLHASDLGELDRLAEARPTTVEAADEI